MNAYENRYKRSKEEFKQEILNSFCGEKDWNRLNSYNDFEIERVDIESFEKYNEDICKQILCKYFDKDIVDFYFRNYEFDFGTKDGENSENTIYNLFDTLEIYECLKNHKKEKIVKGDGDLPEIVCPDAHVRIFNPHPYTNWNEKWLAVSWIGSAAWDRIHIIDLQEIFNIKSETCSKYYYLLRKHDTETDIEHNRDMNNIEESVEEEPLEEELMVFPEELNQELFEGDQLREEVRDKLIEIGNSFYETFDLKFDIIDMYFEGSMAQYNWVDLKNINGVEGLDYKSDIDLHLVVDYKQIGLPEEIISDYFIAKKQVFNEYHNITVKGFEVELGCEDSNTPLHSQGVYSLYKDEWIKKPSPVSEEVENIRDNPDYDEFRTYLINTVKSGDYHKAKDLWDKVKYMRKKSLALDGEFGKGNLIFKALRQERLLDLLWTFVHNEEDKQLSLMESYDIEKRIEEIVNPDGYTEDQYNELMDHDPEDEEYWQQIDAELKDCEDEALSIRARKEQIEEIKHGEQRLDTQIENNEPCIHVEFNHGDDDIGHCAEITADFFDSELPWVINIIDYSYGAFDISVSYQDITRIFGIKEELIKEYLGILKKYGQIDKSIKNSINFSKNIKKDKEVIEESTLAVDMRYDNIVNPQHLDEDKLNDIEEQYCLYEDGEIEDFEYSEDDISELFHELEYNVPARKEQIELIKNGKQEINYVSWNRPVILVHFNKTNSDDNLNIGTRASIRPILHSNYLGNWYIDINARLGGFDDANITPNDLIQIFGIKPELIKQVFSENSDKLKHQLKSETDSRPEVIEESIIETSELNALLREAEDLIKVESWYSDIFIDSDEFKKLREFFVKKFNDKIVDFTVKYITSWWNVENYLDQKVTLYKMGKICLTIYTMASHIEEEILTSDNFIRIELINSQNWRVGTVLREAYEDTFNVYEDISNDESMTFYDVTARELVEVFNVKNRDLLRDLINRSIYRDKNMKSEDEDRNVIEESLKDSSDSIISKCLKRLNLKYDTDIMTNDMYPELEDELKDIVEPHILKYTAKLISNTFRPIVAIYINMALRLQDIANHTEEEFRPTSGILVLDNDTGDCSHVVKYPARRKIFEIERVGEPWNTLEFKNAKDLVELFHIKPENLRQLIRYHELSYLDGIKKGIYTGKDLEVSHDRFHNIEESVDNKYEKYNKTGLSREEIESFKSELAKEYDIKLVNYAFYYSSTYIGDDNLIDADIILQTLNIFKKIANHTREVVSDYKEIWLLGDVDGSEQMIGKVTSTFFRKKLNYNLWVDSHAYFDIKPVDLVNVFNVSPDSISKLTTQTVQYGDIVHSPKDIIEEAYENNDKNLTEQLVGTYLRTFGLYQDNFDKIKTFLPKYDAIKLLDQETFESLQQDLCKFYEPRIVEFASDYVLRNIANNDVSKISMVLLFRYVIIMELIAKHSSERVYDNSVYLVGIPSEFDAYKKATLICYIINSNVKYSIYFDENRINNLFFKDLIEVFHINEENIRKLTKESISDEIKVSKSDAIEETINPQDGRVFAIQQHILKEFPNLVSEYGQFPVNEDSQPIIDYLKTQFDEKYVDYQINWYKKVFDSPIVNVHSLIVNLFNMKEIAEHRDETISVLNSPCIQLGITDHYCVFVYYDVDAREFNMEIDDGAFWYGITARELVKVFNVSQKNVAWLIKTTYNENKDNWARKLLNKRNEVIEESVMNESSYIMEDKQREFVKQILEELKLKRRWIDIYQNRLERTSKLLKDKYFDSKIVDYCATHLNDSEFLGTFIGRCYALNELINHTEEKIVSLGKENGRHFDTKCLSLYYNDHHCGDVHIVNKMGDNLLFSVDSDSRESFKVNRIQTLVDFFNIKRENIEEYIKNNSQIRSIEYKTKLRQKGSENNKKINIEYLDEESVMNESSFNFIEEDFKKLCSDLNIKDSFIELSFVDTRPILYKRFQKVAEYIKQKLYGEGIVNLTVKYFKNRGLNEISLREFFNTCNKVSLVAKHNDELIITDKEDIIWGGFKRPSISLKFNSDEIGQIIFVKNEYNIDIGYTCLWDISVKDIVEILNVTPESITKLTKLSIEYDNSNKDTEDIDVEELDEEFVTMKQRNTSYGKVVNSIVKNPTLKELKELAKEEEDNTFRVVVSEEQNPDFYFGTANEWIHHEITDTINLDSLTFYCYDLSTNTFYFNMSVEDREEALEYYFDFYYYFKENSYLTSTFGDFNLVLFDKDIVGDTPFDSNIGDEGMYVFSKEELDAFENSERNNLDECCSATCAGDVAATVLPFGGIGSKYKAKKGDWKKSAEQINKEIVDNMV